MRYMWMCNRQMPSSFVREDLGFVKDDLESRRKSVVMRVFTTSKRACSVFITDYVAYHNALLKELVDCDSTYWSITSCNKQYVTDENTGEYLGCLAEVDPEEALAWIKDDDKNFSLSVPNGNDRRIWIPVMRNPNKLIPTGESIVCPACGRIPRPQYRPWPLHADA